MSIQGEMHLNSIWECCFWYTHLECQLQKILQEDFSEFWEPNLCKAHSAGICGPCWFTLTVRPSGFA